MAAEPQAFTSFPLDPLAADARSVVRASPGGRGRRPALLAERLPSGDVRCHACAHRCLIRPDRRGICGVRENDAGRLMSLVFGEVAAAVLEPIEKKPLYHAWPGTAAYSLGTQGCNLHCRFCQNWEIAQAPREHLLPRTRQLSPDAAVAEAIAARARSIAYTYTEPTVFIEYVVETAALARDAGLGNVLVTNGYQTHEAIALLATVVDAANVDLKGFTDEVYRRICGARLAHVLEGLVAMREAGIWLEVTTLLVPEVDDDTAALARLAAWIAAELGPETPWHVSRFYPAFRMIGAAPTALESLERAAAIGRDAGLRHVYIGNAPELASADTACAGCGRIVLRRAGHALAESLLVEGRCPGCGHRLAGIELSDAASNPGADEPRSAPDSISPMR